MRSSSSVSKTDRGKPSVGSIKLAYTVNEFRQASGIGRTRIYDEINAGRLRTVKFGRSRLIPADAANEFIAKLGQAEKAAA